MLRLKDILIEKGLTQKDLANKLGIAEMTLSRNVNGNPTLQTLTKIASALGVELWELFTKSTDKGEFVAIIKDGAEYYHARTLSELEVIVKEIKAR